MERKMRKNWKSGNHLSERILSRKTAIFNNLKIINTFLITRNKTLNTVFKNHLIVIQDSEYNENQKL